MFLRRLPIRIQLLVIAAITILITFTIFFITYSQISDIIMKKNVRYTEQLISQLKKSLSTNYNEISDLLINLGYDSTIQDFMLECDPYSIYEKGIKVSSLLSTVKSAKSDMYDIVIIGKNGQFSSLCGGVEYARDMENTTPPDGYVRSTGFIQTLYWEEDVYRFLFGVKIVSLNRDRFYGEQIGFAAAIVDASKIIDYINKFPELSGVKIYLMDKNGRFFSNIGKANSDEKTDFISNLAQNQLEPVVSTVDGEKCIIQVCDIPEIEGKIISVVSEKALFSELSAVQLWNLSIFILALVFLAIPLSIVIRNIQFPLKKLVDFMNEIKSGNLKNLKKRIKLDGYAEMTTMAREFNEMLDEIDALTHRLVDTSTRLFQTELDRKESILAFMQSQINPHFLYNTFECINGIASVRGVPEIKDITKALSKIFCYSVKGSDEVCVKEEISIVKSYVQIQKIRFSERFNVEYDIPDYICNCIVPKMILQPIIENAIFHGIEPLTRKGDLHISGRIDERDVLNIVVKDNGAGIDCKTLDMLKYELESHKESFFAQPNKSIGLVNVHSRIKLKYGNEFGLSVCSEPDFGTEVTIKLPAGRMNDVQSFVG